MATSQRPPTSSLKRYALPAAIFIAIAIGLVIYFSSSDPEPQHQSTPTASAPVFGPGSLNSSDTGDSLNKHAEATPPLLAPPGGLVSNPDGQLQINPALHDVIDFFLLQQAGANRLASLQEYLRSKLTGPAYTQALQIVDHYQAYMPAHDSLLASQNLGNANSGIGALSVDRLNTWREQRDRMRLSMLGDAVVQSWYQDDDNKFTQALNQLQQRIGSPSTSPPSNTAPSTTDGHMLTNQEQEDLEILASIGNETKSFSTRGQEQRLWATNFQTYVTAATRIKQQQGLGFAERERLLQDELNRLFPNQTERQRARDMGP